MNEQCKRMSEWMSDRPCTNFRIIAVVVLSLRGTWFVSLSRALPCLTLSYPVWRFAKNKWSFPAVCLLCHPLRRPDAVPNEAFAGSFSENFAGRKSFPVFRRIFWPFFCFRLELGERVRVVFSNNSHWTCKKGFGSGRLCNYTAFVSGLKVFNFLCL